MWKCVNLPGDPPSPLPVSVSKSGSRPSFSNALNPLRPSCARPWHHGVFWVESSAIWGLQNKGRAAWRRANQRVETHSPPCGHDAPRAALFIRFDRQGRGRGSSGSQRDSLLFHPITLTDASYFVNTPLMVLQRSSLCDPKACTHFFVKYCLWSKKWTLSWENSHKSTFEAHYI